MRNIFLLTIFALALGAWVSGANAATLFTLPSSGELNAGDVFVLNVLIDSEGESINAAQAVMHVPTDVFEVQDIDFSSSFSIFSFWLEEPKLAEDGTLAFIGGTTNGVSGKALPVLKLTLRAKGVGGGDIMFDDAAITASDGSGTNVLSTIIASNFRIEPARIVVSAPAPKPENKEVVSPAPEQEPSVIAVSEPAPAPEEPEGVLVVEPAPLLLAESEALAAKTEESVNKQPQLAVAGLEITRVWFFVWLSVMLAAGFSGGWLARRKFRGF